MLVVISSIPPVHTSLDWDPCQRIHPRANSAGQLVRSPSPDSDDEDGEAGEAVTKLQLTRLATSDLRNLELRSVQDRSNILYWNTGWIS